jgi:hypothetical protein
MNMAFKSAFVAHAPDGDSEKHRCVIETSKYKLFVVVVQNQGEAVQVCQNLVKQEGIHSILLCPGFTHKNVAEIAEAVGEDVGVFVTRGDGPSSGVTRAVMEREGWFPKQ